MLRERGRAAIAACDMEGGVGGIVAELPEKRVLTSAVADDQDLHWQNGFGPKREPPRATAGAAISAKGRERGRCPLRSGAELFAQALPLADRIHMSVIDAEPEGDVLMPDIDTTEWREVASEERPGFRYVVLERRPAA